MTVVPQKYLEERVPRYTSYPTANVFSQNVTSSTYETWLSSLSPDEPVSLYIHVPYCRSMCWYCGCHTKVTKQEGPLDTYVEALTKELKLLQLAIGGKLAVGHLHFGGGTPTIIGPERMGHLMGELKKTFHFLDNAEIAIEVDPRTFDQSLACQLERAGFNRASVGVQSFDQRVQRAIGRVQTPDQTGMAVDMMRKAGVRGINFDLIYGLPYQTTKSCIDTVDTALAMKPERFSVFGYAHLPGFKKHQNMIPEHALPNAKQRREQADTIAMVLCNNGYEQIGLDHFALPQDNLSAASRTGELHRNFQGYTTDSCNTLIGLGASAIGRLPQGYYQNEVSFGRYLAKLADGELPVYRGHALTLRDRERAQIIERLMCDYEFDFDDLEAVSRPVLSDLLTNNPRLAELTDEGLVRISGNHLEIDREARFIVRSVAACFDDYLGWNGSVHSTAA